jgi:hypothetical protein
MSGEIKADTKEVRREEARRRREEEKREAERHRKFDRNLRVVAGVVTVLGAAATTLMKVMEIESAHRARKIKVVKGKTRTVRKLKAAPKPKRLAIPQHMKLLLDDTAVQKLQMDARATLRMAKKLNKEVTNGGS